MKQKDEPDLNPRQISRDAPLDFVKISYLRSCIFRIPDLIFKL
jgi:hypothetical protein